MGLFYHTFQVGPKNGVRLGEITALVDTGSVYALLPSDFLEDLGVLPEWESVFEIADGSEVEYPMGQITCVLDGMERVNVCIFGPAGCQPLLGAFTLESFGLMADPVNRRLVPARLLLG